MATGAQCGKLERGCACYVYHDMNEISLNSHIEPVARIRMNMHRINPSLSGPSEFVVLQSNTTTSPKSEPCEFPNQTGIITSVVYVYLATDRYLPTSENSTCS